MSTSSQLLWKCFFVFLNKIQWLINVCYGDTKSVSLVCIFMKWSICIYIQFFSNLFKSIQCRFARCMSIVVFFTVSQKYLKWSCLETLFLLHNQVCCSIDYMHLDSAGFNRLWGYSPGKLINADYAENSLVALGMLFMDLTTNFHKQSSNSCGSSTENNTSKQWVVGCFHL